MIDGRAALQAAKDPDASLRPYTTAELIAALNLAYEQAGDGASYRCVERLARAIASDARFIQRITTPKKKKA